MLAGRRSTCLLLWNQPLQALCAFTQKLAGPLLCRSARPPSRKRGKGGRKPLWAGGGRPSSPASPLPCVSVAPDETATEALREQDQAERKVSRLGKLVAQFSKSCSNLARAETRLGRKVRASPQRPSNFHQRQHKNTTRQGKQVSFSTQSKIPLEYKNPPQP